MFRVVQSISIPNISHNMMNGRRMSLPVDPAYLVYSNFEHVYGTAAPQGTQGIAISQLKLLDALIGRLSQLKGEEATAIITASIDPESPAAAAQIEALVETYRNEFARNQAASAAMPYIPVPASQSGAVFNLVA